MALDANPYEIKIEAETVYDAVIALAAYSLVVNRPVGDNLHVFGEFISIWDRYVERPEVMQSKLGLFKSPSDRCKHLLTFAEEYKHVLLTARPYSPYEEEK